MQKLVFLGSAETKVLTKIKHRTNLRTTALGDVEEVDILGIRTGLATFGNIVHDADSGALDLIAETIILHICHSIIDATHENAGLLPNSQIFKTTIHKVESQESRVKRRESGVERRETGVERRESRVVIF